jgi:hypothetical protein
MLKNTFVWLEERLGLTGIYKTVLDRKIPAVNWWFYPGSASLFLFAYRPLPVCCSWCITSLRG